MTRCEIIYGVLVTEWLHKAEICVELWVLRWNLMLKVYLQTVLAILKIFVVKSVTYVPGNFSANSFEFAFFADSIERFEASCVQWPLEVHVFYMKMQMFAFLCSFDSEVKPGSIEKKLSPYQLLT